MREAMTIASQGAGIGLRAVAAAPTSFALAMRASGC